VYSGLFIIRTTLVKEAGWTIADQKTQRRDAIISAAMMFIISASVMAAAAGTLYVNHISLTSSSEMIALLKPLAGPMTTALFITGFVAAGLSSQFPNVLLLPWLLCDYNNSERDMTKSRYRIIVFLMSLLGLVVPVFKAPPVLVMIASQAFNTVILPLTVLGILVLGNKQHIMHKYRFGFMTNFLLILILLFAVYMSGNGILGLFGIL
jgi:Mn2+/Fe2+ NRAMP family transporter